MTRCRLRHRLISATESSPSGVRARLVHRRRGDTRRCTGHLRVLGRSLLLAFALLAGPGAPLSVGLGVGMPVAHAQGLAVKSAPNRLDPRTGTTSVTHNPRALQFSSAHTPAGPAQHLWHPTMMPMKPGLLPLAADNSARFVGSDGRLEVDVPAGAVTPTDAAAGGGHLGLRITQIAPASGSNAGGSDIVSFGTYLIQLVDANGTLVQHGLRKPVTLKLHVGRRDGAVNLAKAFIVYNSALPAGTTVAPTTATHVTVPPRATGSTSADAGAGSGPAIAGSVGLGTFHTQPSTFDMKSQTLVATTSLSSPSTSMSWNTDAAIASFGKPDPFNVDLNAGALQANFPVAVPSGPGGLTPPINLSYSSASVSEQHSPQGAAGWTGEGWNLSLGAISWAEHDVTSSCPSTCTPTWEDSWQLYDPFGTSAELIPPNINVSTYWDDTANNYCGADGNANNSTSYPCPIAWHTAPETHAKIYAYVGSLSLPDGGGAAPPCFRVFLPNGIMEEFGCTADSLEYYYTPGMGDYIATWNLDLITDPQGNQIHITYQQDSEQLSVSGTNHTYIRDAVPATIEWDSPSCHNAQTMCTGSSWAPLMRVSLSASHSPSRLTNTPSGCNTGSNLRCDDPLDLSGSGGLGAPQVQSSFALNDVLVQVRANGSAGWNTLTDYQFSYAQSGPTTITDPSTGKQESTAGSLLLTQLQQVGDDGATALPVRTFGYTSVTEYYEDDLYQPNPSTNCGPSWNTGNGSGCLLWSQSYAGNSYYLNSASNGLGLAETFSWVNARNNTHGVNGGGSNAANPLYCNGLTGYPCNEADDQDWSHVVLTQEQGQILRAASSGNVTVTSTTGYSYKLTYPLVSQECGDCVAGMYWGNQNDGDYLDYYNGKYMGFTEADVTEPDGALEVHTFYATNGWGVYDTSQVGCYTAMQPNTNTCHNSPWWAYGNLLHGREYETDSYSPSGALLGKTTTQYQTTCPPSGVSGTPSSSQWGNWSSNSSGTTTNLVSELDHNNPVASCDIQVAQSDDYSYEGGSNAVHSTTTYSYDRYGRVTSTTTYSNGGGAATGSATSIVQKVSYVQNDAVNASYSSAGGTYLIDFPAFSDTEDTNGNRYSCTYTSYDGQGYTTGQTSALTLGEATSMTTYTSCGTASNNFTPSGPIEKTMAYDTYGNEVGAADPDANAGNSAHLGCTVGTTQYSNCAAYDSTFAVLPLSTTNALGQTNSLSYGTPAASNGYGLWPVSATDTNGQVTSYTYDALGREIGQTLPGESSGATTSESYTTWCAATGAQTPCTELDRTQRLNSSTTVTTRSFYDGYGRLVETRAAAPGGQDVVQYYVYDVSGRVIFTSNPYFVTAYTGGPGTAAFAAPDANQVGTTKQYDALGRVTSSTDALSHTQTTQYGVVCSPAGTGSDTACYEQALTVDPNGHQIGVLTDAFQRQIYDQRYSGTGASGNPYALYTTTAYTYDYTGNLTQILQPDGVTKTTYTYDLAGRLTGSQDPDRGSAQYSYDADGNVVQTVDARGANGTIYAGYDGLDRQLWRSATNSPTGAYVTYTYDATANGNAGIGRLTSESFTGGPNNTLTGSYSYVYDGRGQTMRMGQTMGGVGACPSGWTCQDIGSPTLAGTQSYVGAGMWTLSGSGSDIWGTSDQFHFVSQALTGDGSISARVSSQTNTSQYAKTGVMLRDGTTANAPFYYIQIEPNGQYFVTDRTTTGGSATTVASGTARLPIFISVIRNGSSFSAATSSDGTHWTLVPDSIVTMSLSNTLQAGVAVTSVNTGALSTATVDSLSTTTGGTGACPSGWTCQDIGSPTLAGTQSYVGAGMWTLSGSGSDIWGTSDQFHFVSQALTGDGSISARVSSQTNTSQYAKTGVMLRDGTTANAAHYYLQVEPNGQYYVTYRATQGGDTTILTSGSVTLPVYLKVTRSGNTFSASTSADGVTWTAVAGSSITLSLSSTLQAGVAVTSVNTGALSTATVDNITPSASPPTSVTTAVVGAPAGVTSYSTQQTYDDAGNPLATTYPDGEVVTTQYTSQGWFGGLTTQPQGSTTPTTLVSAVAYAGTGGAAGLPSSMSLGNGTYTYSATYDPLTRITDSKLTRQSDSATLFEEARSYDAAGNVASITTTVPQGTDVQQFCYDEQNRVTWAGSAGTPPCTGTAIAAGTLTAAQYTQSFAYDTMGRLTSGQLGSYTYGDSAHVHAATSIGTSYTASYDAAGNMTCRAPSSATTCSETNPTGAQLAYDNEGRLVTWQNTPSSPTSTDAFLYDGEGNRVEQQSTTGLPGNPVTTTSVYVGALEEVQTSGTTTTTTVYYYAGSKLIATAVNGTLSYLATSALGSPTVAVDATGNPVATTLYAPYGSARYQQGTMPLDNGFTGQHTDTVTGLDYFGARYYDPLAGQFTSADTVLPGGGFDPWGLSRYAYVEGNPISMIDPTGHWGFWDAVKSVGSQVLDATTGIPSMISDVQTIFSGQASFTDKLFAGADLALNVFMDATYFVGVGEGLRVAYAGFRLGAHVVSHVIEHVAEHVVEHVAQHVVEHVAEHVTEHVAEHVAEHATEHAVEHVVEQEAEHTAEHGAEKAASAGAGCGLSFAASTLVLTPSGEQAISSLKVGQPVTAYDPKTGKSSTQTVQHVFLNHDSDLLDVTLKVSLPAKAQTKATGKTTATARASGTAQHTITTHEETIHTTANHPWFTADHGWLPASFMRLGEPVVTAGGGTTATVVAIRVVPGTASMWDLTVANVHTFAVGMGQYVVHNCGGVDQENPEIKDSKLDYLTKHREEDDKAGGFEDLGYTAEHKEELRELLRSQAKDADLANPQEVTQYGKKYIVDNDVTGLNGRQGSLRTVWQVDHGDNVMRLITAIMKPW